MEIKKLSEYKYEIPAGSVSGMKVPGIVYVNNEFLQRAKNDKALEQVINVAFLPGVVKASYAMPDIHWGYGFPIGGVAATDASNGVVSPGGVGFDISCGVRLLRTNLNAAEVKDYLEKLFPALAGTIPRGVGKSGSIRLSNQDMKKVLSKGVEWAIENGYGWKEDIDYTENKGKMKSADPNMVSNKALERGRNQVGTLGAGNHFIEIQEITDVYDSEIAEKLMLFNGQLVVMIHSGSRGLGHQVCSDYIKILDRVVKKIGYNLPDRQLACAPIKSKEGSDYIAAMSCAVNYALANRQCLGHWVRLGFEKVFKKSSQSLGMSLLYDVSHNIARFEEHNINGEKKALCVHRKGATRSFGPGEADLPVDYRETGQPVIIPGDMGTHSFILAGTGGSMKEAFGSTCHGAGRVMSRTKAKKKIRGWELKKELEEEGISIYAGKMSLLAEEAPAAYKDVEKVVNICQGAGLSKKVARMRPLGVLKG